MPRPAAHVVPTRLGQFLELGRYVAHFEAILHHWPLVSVARVSMHPGVMLGWEEWGAARGSVHLTSDRYSEQHELLGWLLSDGGKLERPYRDDDPHDGWHVLWRGWRWYTQIPVTIVPKPTPPNGDLFHDFPDGPGPHACRRPGCSAGSRMPSARTPCALPRHLAEIIDQAELGPGRAA